MPLVCSAIRTAPGPRGRVVQPPPSTRAVRPRMAERICLPWATNLVFPLRERVSRRVVPSRPVLRTRLPDRLIRVPPSDPARENLPRWDPMRCHPPPERRRRSCPIPIRPSRCRRCDRRGGRRSGRCSLPRWWRWPLRRGCCWCWWWCWSSARSIRSGAVSGWRGQWVARSGGGAVVQDHLSGVHQDLAGSASDSAVVDRAAHVQLHGLVGLFGREFARVCRAVEDVHHQVRRNQREGHIRASVARIAGHASRFESPKIERCARLGDECVQSCQGSGSHRARLQAQQARGGNVRQRRQILGTFPKPPGQHS